MGLPVLEAAHFFLNSSQRPPFSAQPIDLSMNDPGCVCGLKFVFLPKRLLQPLRNQLIRADTWLASTKMHIPRVGEGPAERARCRLQAGLLSASGP